MLFRSVFRAPRENKIHVIVQNDNNLYTTDNIEDLNGKDGFVIAPFQCNQNTPICLVRADKRWSIDIECTNQASHKNHIAHKYSYPTKDYQKRFDLFSEALHKGDFEKLVLSRSHINKEINIDLEKSFLKACTQYQHSYVYFFYTPITGIWMGSTPEILLSNRSGKWLTVALAGTQSLNNGQLPESWDIKNKKEQDLVSVYIRNLLKEYGIIINETKPYSVKAGQLSHIRTDFYFTLDNSNQLGSLLKSLHPTPAVCGMPKKEAYYFIAKNEGYSRKYYSGFIGLIDPNGMTDLFVNLRCIHFEQRGYTLYAGGGLLASSNIKDEWLETEKKMHTMKNILIAQ